MYTALAVNMVAMFCCLFEGGDQWNAPAFIDIIKDKLPRAQHQSKVALMVSVDLFAGIEATESFQNQKISVSAQGLTAQRSV